MDTTTTYADSINAGDRFQYGYGLVTAAQDAETITRTGYVPQVRVTAYVKGSTGRTFVATFPTNGVAEVAR
jgi:hypothetical protein